MGLLLGHGGRRLLVDAALQAPLASHPPDVARDQLFPSTCRHRPASAAAHLVAIGVIIIRFAVYRIGAYSLLTIFSNLHNALRLRSRSLFLPLLAYSSPVRVDYLCSPPTLDTSSLPLEPLPRISRTPSTAIRTCSRAAQTASGIFIFALVNNSRLSVHGLCVFFIPVLLLPSSMRTLRFGCPIPVRHHGG